MMQYIFNPTLNLETNRTVGDKICKKSFQVYDTDTMLEKVDN